MGTLEVKGLTVRYGALTIVDSVSFTLEPGRWLMIAGPNGAGKSTIVNAVTQGAPYTGEVLLEGMDVRAFKPHELARRIGVLSQNHFVGYAFTVEEVVRLGRYAYSQGLLRGAGAGDTAAVEYALEKTGLTALRTQSVLTLSGGELQRTFLAQLFAQDPGMIILDEPANHLDLVYQKQVFGLIREWIQKTGRSVISVVHDLSLAKAYGTDALLIDRGKLVSSGPIGEVLTRENLQRVYSMDVYAYMQEMLAQWE